MSNRFYTEFIEGRKLSDWLFLCTGLLLQVVAYCWMCWFPIEGASQPNPWSLVSGLFGIVSIVLCSQGKVSTFFVGFVQIITYTWLCWLERFYAGIAMNVFYFGSQIYGIFVWRNRYSEQANPSVQTRTLSLRWLAFWVGVVLAVSCLIGWVLSHFDDSQPYLDAFTTVPAIFAQILMVTAYRQHWYFWLAIDLVYIVMWSRAGDACMVMQYAFWCLNCLYGLHNWYKLEK